MPVPLVILWWGSDVRILGSDGVIARFAAGPDDPLPAIVRLAAENRGAARSARILYHPASLDVHEVACPKTGRARLRRILSHEHPALDAPGAVWSVEGIRRSQKGYSTVLYLDRAARLPGLVSGLRASGLETEGAWPLQTLIDAAPACQAGGGRYLAVVALGARAAVSCGISTGERSARYFEGDENAEAAMGEMEACLARFEDDAPPAGLIVSDECPHAEAFAGALRSPTLARMPLAAFMGLARTLPERGLSDFLRRKPAVWRLPGRRLTAAATGGCLMAASAAMIWKSQARQEASVREAALWRQRHVQLQQSVESREELALKIADASASLNIMASAPQAHYRFLAALSAGTPEAIALQALALQAGVFNVKGRVYPEAEGAGHALQQLRAALSAPGAPWRLESAPVSETGPDFSLTGAFTAGTAEP